MLLLIGGVLALAGLLLLGYLFVSSDPRQLAQNLPFAAFAAAVALILILSPGRPGILLLLPFTLLLIPECRRWFRARWRGASRSGPSRPPPPRFLHVVPDRETGAAVDTVISGIFAGSRLEELSRDELLTLLKECRVVDPEAAASVEAFLHRAHPGWDGAADDAADMTVGEALTVLGLDSGASEMEIVNAHRRLLQRLNLDRNSSDYFATKINRAREVLLRRR